MLTLLEASDLFSHLPFRNASSSPAQRLKKETLIMSFPKIKLRKFRYRKRHLYKLIEEIRIGIPNRV